MKVFINDEEVRLFSGARVRDGLNAFSRNIMSAVNEGKLTVTDGEGNRVYLDGHLEDGDHLILSESLKKGPGAGESCS